MIANARDISRATVDSAPALRELAREASSVLRATTFADQADRRLALTFAEDLAQLVDAPLAEQFPGDPEVRALSFAPRVLGESPAAGPGALGRAARAAFGLVRWTEFYAEDAWSRDFLPRFANGEGIGPDGRLRHDRLILGLFLLGPDTLYPAHAHPAEEFYIVLDGTPAFQVGAGGEFVARPPGSVILHHANVCHAIRSGGEAFYGVFGWRGEIDAPSWYRDDMTDPNEPIKYPTVRKA